MGLMLGNAASAFIMLEISQQNVKDIDRYSRHKGPWLIQFFPSLNYRGYHPTRRIITLFIHSDSPLITFNFGSITD